MVGTTVFMKTSGEEVFVLGTSVLPAGRNDYPMLGDTIYIVRRFVAGQNGVQHVTEAYYPQELETKEDIVARREAEQTMFEERVQKARKQAGLDAEDNTGEPVLN